MPEKNRKNRILAAVLVLIALAVVLGVSAFMNQRQQDREMGHAHGYTAGYSIGYTDFLNGNAQNAQLLAGEIVPYETGSGKWKYFIMGFDEGYADGLSGEMVWDINAP